MKKFIIILSLLAAVAVGFAAGSTAVLSAPKWVEEDSGMYLIVTDFGGQEFVDVAEKSTQQYQRFEYIAYSTARIK